MANVEQANWIKPRENGAKAYVLTFQREIFSSYIKITGEYSLTKVFEYKVKPLQCAKCQKYGHTLISV